MHQVVDHDLPARSMGAQPRRLDDRLAEIVAVLAVGVADAHADPHAELLLGAAVARLDGLLHLGRARQRLGGAGEHHHQPIAEVLHLPAARALERAAQQPKVLCPQLLRSLRADPIGDRGRTHQIGHQDRDHLCGSRAHPPIIQLSLLPRLSRVGAGCPADVAAR